MPDRGPVVYENWQAAIQGLPRTSTLEFPLFTDAHVTGDLPDGCGPYRLLNAVARPSTGGVTRPAIVLQIDDHLQEEPATAGDVKKTEATLYHGGIVSDEVAALFSLCLGMRLKPGGLSRRFETGQPFGRPVGYDPRQDPVLLRADYGVVLPGFAREHSLNGCDMVTTLPAQTPAAATILVRVARLYQDAVWLAESQPPLAWLLLVSAVETAASYWKGDIPAVEAFSRAKPALAEYLTRIDASSCERVAREFEGLFGATAKFVDFVTAFRPPPPPERPDAFLQHDWTQEELLRSLKKIYDYRSRALHDGQPFPYPMCQPPPPLSSNSVPPEKPYFVAIRAMGGSWLAKDVPMLLHTFEYIARSVLCQWWRAGLKSEDAS